MPLPETLVALADFLRLNTYISKDVADAAALRAVVTTELLGGEFISLADGTIYSWVSAAVGADDSNLIILPTDTGGAGRWINISKTLRDRREIPTAHADVAAIRALASLSLIGGELISLASGILYIWLAADAGVDDGDLILTPTDTAGAGRWRKSAILAV